MQEIRMDTQLANINSQDVSTLICDYLICKHCWIVDRDHTRSRIGSECSTCNNESEGGSLYFPINIHILIDLVQQAYHSKAPVGPITGPQVPEIGTIILICTLREALLNGFLLGHLRAQRVPDALIEKLLSDNKLANQMFGELFTSIVGCKWKNAVVRASEYDKRDYLPTSKVLLDAATIRNEFLHEGRAWDATHEFATACVNNMPSLMALFVALHNVYIRPLRAIMPSQSGC